MNWISDIVFFSVSFISFIYLVRFSLWLLNAFQSALNERRMCALFICCYCCVWLYSSHFVSLFLLIHSYSFTFSRHSFLPRINLNKTKIKIIYLQNVVNRLSCFDRIYIFVNSHTYSTHDHEYGEVLTVPEPHSYLCVTWKWSIRHIQQIRENNRAIQKQTATVHTREKCYSMSKSAIWIEEALRNITATQSAHMHNNNKESNRVTIDPNPKEEIKVFCSRSSFICLLLLFPGFTLNVYGGWFEIFC